MNEEEAKALLKRLEEERKNDPEAIRRQKEAESRFLGRVRDFIIGDKDTKKSPKP